MRALKNFIWLIIFVYQVIICAQTADEFEELGDQYYFNIDNHDYQEAIKNYKNALELQKNNLIIYEKLAKCYEWSGDFEQAIKTLNEELQVVGIDTSNIKYLIYSNIGKLYMQISDKYITKSLYTNEEYIREKETIELTQKNRTKNLISAIENFKSAIENQSSDNFKNIFRERPHNIYFNMSIANARLGNYDDEIQYALKAYKNLNLKDELDKLNRVLYIQAIGEAYHRKSEYPKALEWYNKGLTYEPDNVDLNEKIGQIYDFKKNYKSALVYFNKAIKKCEKELNAIKNQTNPGPFDNYEKAMYEEKIVRLNKQAGTTLSASKNKTKALEYFIKAFDIRKTKLLKNLIINTSIENSEHRNGWVRCIGSDGIEIINVENGSYFYNTKKIKKMPGGVKQVWFKIIEIPEEKFSPEEIYNFENDFSIKENSFELANQKYGYKLIQFEFKCSNETIRVIQELEYDEKGNVIESYNPNLKDIEWSGIVPDSIGESLYELFCK